MKTNISIHTGPDRQIISVANGPKVTVEDNSLVVKDKHDAVYARFEFDAKGEFVGRKPGNFICDNCNDAATQVYVLENVELCHSCFVKESVRLGYVEIKQEVFGAEEWNAAVKVIRDLDPDGQQHTAKCIMSDLQEFLPDLSEAERVENILDEMEQLGDTDEYIRRVREIWNVLRKRMMAAWQTKIDELNMERARINDLCL